MHICYGLRMPKKVTKIQVGMKLDKELLEELDRYQASLPVETTRTAIVEAAIRLWLDRESKVVDIRRRK